MFVDGGTDSCLCGPSDEPPHTTSGVRDADCMEKKLPISVGLRVCLVDTGDGKPVQVVCGAPNARTGMTGVFVPPGAFIPGKNMTLAVGTIRGVESRGMLVSEFELQISDDHEGIIDLPADAPVGASFAQYAGLDDPVIDINLTTNRPDCTGVSGIGAGTDPFVNAGLEFLDSTRPMLGAGGGLLIQGGPVVVDLGYRYNKISAGNAIQSALTGGDLGVHQVRFGLGVRF